MKDINFKQTEDTLFLEEEHIILREQVKKFVETEVKPVAQNWESNGFIPREVFKKMGALGFLGITYPTEFGGSEMDVRGRWFLQRNLESLHFLALQLLL